MKKKKGKHRPEKRHAPKGIMNPGLRKQLEQMDPQAGGMRRKPRKGK